jgi:uncharacterized membrane protein
MTSVDANKKNYKKDYLKFSLALVLCLLARLIPLRAPNVEPILATTMPMSRAYGAFAGFSFGVLSILLYDMLTGTLGIQTFFTAGAYGILGLWATSYFQKHKANAWGYIRFAIMGTLFFDSMTGLTVGPIIFHQSFFTSLLGQIPFTALHLTSNIAFAFILSPAVYNFLIKKDREKLIDRKIDFRPPINIPKTI